MKKYLLGLAAVVVALSLSAFTGNYKKVEKINGTADLHWFEAPYNGADFQATTATVALRTSQIDCNELDETPECERAYRDDQLVTPGVPSSGVKSAEKSKYQEIIYLNHQ
ncbi:MAG: hypothetical protein DI535_02630 [Citrobacter freundii]|nr:MAG: hypothetical protein DI535_02630 [Citrobacter freundii]